VGLLQAEGDLVVAVTARYRFEVRVPGFAGLTRNFSLDLPVSMSKVHATSFDVNGLPSCS